MKPQNSIVHHTLHYRPFDCMFRKFYRRHVFLVSFFLLFLVSCQDDSDTPLFVPEYLQNHELVATISRDQVVNQILDAPFEIPYAGAFFRFDVNLVRLFYHTVSYDGSPVVASGVLLIPDFNAEFPVLSFQHGTIYDPSEAPSLMNSPYTDLGAFFAAAGFITILPDYLGYGASSHIAHPYQHRETLATATRDMIRASYEYFKVKNLRGPSKNLFLTGYSQGGYATMATLKMMQEKHAAEFSVTAATVGGGPYNKTASVHHLMSLDEEHDDINTYLWVLDSYNRIYPELNRANGFYYNEPYAGIISQYGIFAQVEKNPSLLFTPAFRNGILNQTDMEWLSVLSDNDIYSWKTDLPLQIYHGTDDLLVPFLNAQSTFDAMTAAGSKHIEFIPIEGGTHSTSFWDYMLGTFMFLLQYAFDQ